MAPNRYYSSNAVQTTLVSPISNSATTVQVASVVGYPTNFPFTIQVELGTSNEEIVEVTNIAGTTLTVVRGVDGSSALAHSAGAAVVHGVSARDFREPQEHIGNNLGVHGLSPSTALVGTDTVQTLSNKTLNAPVLSSPVIANFSSAQHDHGTAAKGGTALGGVGTPVSLLGAPSLTDYTNAGHNHSSPATGGSTLGPVTLSSATLTGQPTIADLTNVQHDHSTVVKGGTGIPQASVTGLPTRLTNIESLNTTQDSRLTTIESAPHARLTRGTDQAIANSAFTAVSWSSAVEDTATGWVLAPNPTRYTAARSGIYLVSAVVAWASDATGIREMDFRLNGSAASFFDGQRAGSFASITFIQSAARTVRIVAGDYIEVVVWQSSGGSLNLQSSYHDSPRFEITWLRP